MLILTRRTGEVLSIGEHIKITVLGVRGEQVRLGFEAPRDVAINRKEVHERIEHEKGNEPTERASDE